MNLDKLEKYLELKIFPDLERGRPDFDKPHTQAVVHHLKQILAHTLNPELDETVLLIAAYAHDWGYADLFQNGQPVGLRNVKDQKLAHQQAGALKTSSLLEEDFFNFLTPAQKKRITHLVAIHDQPEKLHDRDELTLLEADVMGGLDTDFITPTFSQADNRHWLLGIQAKKIPLFVNSYSQETVVLLIKKRQDSYRIKAKSHS